MKKLITLSVALLVFLVGVSRAETAREWFNKGYEASIAKNYDEAIKCYKKAITILPDYADAHANLGASYNMKEMFDEAISALRKATSIDPNHVGAHYNLGIAYDKKGMTEEAISEYEKIIYIDPKFALVYKNLGIVYFEEGFNSMAAECFYEGCVLFLEQDNIQNALELYDALKLTESHELEKALFEKLFPELKQKSK